MARTYRAVEVVHESHLIQTVVGDLCNPIGAGEFAVPLASLALGHVHARVEGLVEHQQALVLVRQAEGQAQEARLQRDQLRRRLVRVDALNKAAQGLVEGRIVDRVIGCVRVREGLHSSPVA
jgi:hypothetical protein